MKLINFLVNAATNQDVKCGAMALLPTLCSKLMKITYLCKLLHIGRFNINNVEALVGDLQVPQVDAEVVRREVGLLVRVQRYGVYVVRVGVREYPPVDNTM